MGFENSPVTRAQFKALVDSQVPQVKVVSWADGTDEEIVAMVAAADAGKIRLADHWKVGDTRKVKLAAMDYKVYGPAYDAQTVEFTLMNVGGKELVGGGECSFVVGMKDCLNKAGSLSDYMTNGYWGAFSRRKWCNETFRVAIPSSIRAIFKQFKCAFSNYNGTYSATTNDYFALPSEREISGRDSDSSDPVALRQFDWYRTSSNREKHIKPGASGDLYWTRSASPSGGSAYFLACLGTSGFTSDFVNEEHGISPFGVI